MARKAIVDIGSTVAEFVGDIETKQEKAGEVFEKTSKENKKRVSLSLNPSDYKKIKEIASRKRVSASSLISMLIADCIEKEY